MTHLQQAREWLGEAVLEEQEPEPQRLDVSIAPDNLVSAVQSLIDRRWGYLATITGLDPGPETGDLELLYHFCSDAEILTLRVRVPREAARMPSICSVIPSASIYEREIIEMYGVDFPDTPDKHPLFLPDDWPDGVYPLRKDTVFEENADSG